jgi:hypothetical protein
MTNPARRAAEQIQVGSRMVPREIHELARDVDVHEHIAMRNGDGELLRTCGRCGDDLGAKRHIRSDENAYDARVRIITAAIAEATAELRQENADLQAIFDLQWKASMRAVEEWRKQDPEGRKLVLPDLKNHMMWCFEQLAELRQENERVREALTAVTQMPQLDYEEAGMDCGNYGDVYEDGYQAGLRDAAARLRAALAAPGKQG